MMNKITFKTFLETSVGLTKTAYIEHDTDENGFAVYDCNGKYVDKFWYERQSEKKDAHRKALELLKRLRKETKQDSARG